ncbi:MAG: hypothetical protein FJW93_01755 [Actinobacteria bacterium]|nr:hypothetical protein [Actinomycetota bacterium]
MKKPRRAERDATIDFRMMRRAMIDSVRAGDVSVRDACDAHRDLVRAGRHYGMPRNTPCPMCATASLRNVTYLFGPRLPKSGRCITSRDELRAVDRRPEIFTAYTVEVCVACEWHHLLTATPRGGARPRKRRSAGTGARESTAQQVRRRA